MSFHTFRIARHDGAARTGRLTTPHGVVNTPAFMPVGTAGAMKGMHWREVRDAGSNDVLVSQHQLLESGQVCGRLQRALDAGAAGRREVQGDDQDLHRLRS